MDAHGLEAQIVVDARNITRLLSEHRLILLGGEQGEEAGTAHSREGTHHVLVGESWLVAVLVLPPGMVKGGRILMRTGRTGMAVS